MNETLNPRSERNRADRQSFNYKENADFCDAVREPANDFAHRWQIAVPIAYNAFLEGAEIGRKLAAEELKQSLVECRDILCALNTTDSAIKLAYMTPKDIPLAIKRGYAALQKAGAI